MSARWVRIAVGEASQLASRAAFIPTPSQDSRRCPTPQIPPTTNRMSPKPSRRRSVPKPPPPDPAYVVADLLFRSALRQAGLKRAHLPERGLVVLLRVPQPDWIGLFENVWRDRIQNGQGSVGGSGRGWYRDDSNWVAWEADEEPDRLDRKRETDTFPKSLAAGQNCVGITANIEWLPPDLVLSADHSIIVPAPNGQVLRAAAWLLTKTLFTHPPQ